jgi:hypothetical protein
MGKSFPMPHTFLREAAPTTTLGDAARTRFLSVVVRALTERSRSAASRREWQYKCPMPNPQSITYAPD